MSPAVSSEGTPSAGPSSAKNRRKVAHVASACDRCRQRKVRCNGEQPCQVCLEKGADCTNRSTDKRRTKSELEDVKDRLTALEGLFAAHVPNQQQSRPRKRLYHSRTSSPSQMSAAQSTTTSPVDNTSLQASSPVGQPSFILEDLFPPLPADASTQPKTPRFPAISLSSTSFDRLKPTSENGPSVQYGATSIWTHDNYERLITGPSDSRGAELMPGEWVDWSKNLPPSLVPVLSKTVHDQAIDHYAAYYAPWCMVVEIDAFKRDLVTCNKSSIHVRNTSPPRWTTHYSPFLHNVVLWMGLYYNREAWPDVSRVFAESLVSHCTSLLAAEFHRPPLSALRAVNLFGTCLAQPPLGSHDYGYVYYGMTVAMNQVLGLDINCEAYVSQGRMTSVELESRNAAYWAAYLYDLLRAIAAGRNPMIAKSVTDIQVPIIKPESDDAPWYSSSSSIGQETRLGYTLNGVKSMKSTVFHWTAKLGCLLARVVETLYSTKTEASDRDEVIDQISFSLDEWYKAQPFRNPETLPLPHIILLHLTYHLTRIFLFRPFYRATTRLDNYPSAQCDQAAEAILGLLKLFDRYHGLRYGTGTFLNATFTSATVFLLRAVEDQEVGSGGSGSQSTKDIEEITYFMSQLAITFHEAGRGLKILQSLRSEWLPMLNHDNIPMDTITQTLSETLQPNGADSQGGNGNAMTNMNYQNFMLDFPLDEGLYNALLSFVGGT
ncbi:uncharacterized protein IL334_004456 [Kwoniella shivajii]|uniref:Zn(2)-C6 fungal-type domain-containing protein n=1 Tax=Kwoniella shivajii TaxID=564305 RepID=A0ABZ1D1Q7_9TREE|nr:hypothetical protein IL334_004456 [Kwoniella shivajii]